MPVAIAETARSAGPLLPSSLRIGEVPWPGIFSVSVFTLGLENNGTGSKFQDNKGHQIF